MNDSRGEGALVLFGPMFLFAAIGAYLEKNGSFLPPALRKDIIGIVLIPAGVMTIAICIFSRLQAPQMRREKRSGREYFKRACHTLMGIPVEFFAILISGLVLWVINNAPVK